MSYEVIERVPAVRAHARAVSDTGNRFPAVEFPVLVTYGWLVQTGSRLIPESFSSLPERVAGGFLITAGVGLASMRKS